MERGINGIYNGGPIGDDGRSSVIAFNFNQLMNAQAFTGDMGIGLDHAVFGGTLPDWLERDGWIADGKPAFAVYTKEEYARIGQLLAPKAAILAGLLTKVCRIAADVTAELAPEHIRREAEYAGAMVYRFHGIDSAAACLFESGWLQPAADREKPAVCLVKLK